MNELTPEQKNLVMELQKVRNEIKESWDVVFSIAESMKEDGGYDALVESVISIDNGSMRLGAIMASLGMMEDTAIIRAWEM